MKSKITQFGKILKKGIILTLALALVLPNMLIQANITTNTEEIAEELLLEESTAWETLLYGEIGSVVRKIEEHFTTNTTLYIVNETQLRALAEYVNSGNSCLGKEIHLLNDIVLDNSVDWTPIGTMSSQFAGTFDGNSHTISNLSYTNQKYFQSGEGYSNVGLFGVIGERGNVERVKVENSKFTNTTNADTSKIQAVGNIAGTNYGSVEFCLANIMPFGLEAVNEGTKENNYIGLLVGNNENGYLMEVSEFKHEYTFTDENDPSKVVNIMFEYYKKEKGRNQYVEITDFFDNTTYIKAGDTLRIEMLVDKYLYAGLEEGETIKLLGNIDKKYYPAMTLDKRSGDSIIKFKPVGATRGEMELAATGTEVIPITKLTYEYTPTEEDEIQIQPPQYVDPRTAFGENGNGESLYIYYSDDAENFYTGDRIMNNFTTHYINNLYIDTVKPTVSTSVKANLQEDYIPDVKYPEGTELKISVTSNEKIQAAVAPEIQVSFSESGIGKYNPQLNNAAGNARLINAVLDESGRTVWTYKYIVQPGDEGVLGIEYLKGTIKDIVGNEANLQGLKYEDDAEYKEYIVDTTAPTVTILAKNVTDSLTNKSKITYEFKFSESVRNFTAEDIIVNNGTKGTLSNVVKNSDGTYSYTMDINTSVSNGSTGAMQVMIEANACQDYWAGHGNIRAEKIIEIDRKAPTLLSLEAYSTQNTDEYYGTGERITIVARFDETLKTTSTPTLTLKFSESGNAKNTVTSSRNGNQIIYTYTIKDADKGKMSIKGFTGTVYDMAGNSTQVTKKELAGEIIAGTNPAIPNDTTAPTITFKVDGGQYVIDTDDKTSTFKNVVTTNEKLLKFEYVWSTSKTAPTDGWKEIDANTIGVNTEFNIKNEVEKAGTYYLHIKAKDLAYNTTTVTSSAFIVTNAQITLKADITETTNKNVTVTATYGAGLTENKKLEVVGRLESEDTSKVVLEENGTVYAEATDTAGNKVYKKLYVNNITTVNPEIIFEDLTTIQVSGIKYVKVSSNMTSEELTSKMDKEALNNKEPEYKNVTEDKKLKTGTEIVLDGDTKYIVILNGDINGDGKVTFIEDVVMANNYRIGLNRNFSTMQLLAADVDNSGSVEFIADIVAINNYRLGKIKSL